MRRVLKLIGCERGATAIEYGLICSLIIIAMLAALQNFAGATIRLLTNVSTTVVNAS